MCGRFAQYRIPWDYIEPIGLDVPLPGSLDPAPIARYNIPPSTPVLTLHQDSDGLRFTPVPWGYMPYWAKGKRPPAINARVETAATSKFFKDVWQTGRCIVPADGWYEWVTDPQTKVKQPYYIRRKDGMPMYFAAIGQFTRREGIATRPGDGFVIITANSDAGILDIHDRRPVVLSPECAAHWLDPELTPREAEEIVRDRAEPVEAFEWYPVGREVGDVRNEGPELIRDATITRHC